MFVRPAFWPTVRALVWELRWDIAGVIAVVVVMIMFGVAADWAVTHGYLPNGQSTAPSECICR